MSGTLAHYIVHFFFVVSFPLSFYFLDSKVKDMSLSLAPSGLTLHLSLVILEAPGEAVAGVGFLLN